MAVFREEFRKIFTKRTVYILSFLLVLTSLFINYMNEQKRFANDEGYVLFQTSAYRNLMTELENEQEPNVFLKERLEDIDRDIDFSEFDMFQAVLKEMDEVADYDDYLSDIRQKAAELINVSLFSDEKSFYHKNLVKMSEDYSKLTGTKPIWDERAGVEMATGFPDLFILIGIFSICFILITDEKSMFPLLRSTHFGRKRLICAKISVSLIYVFFLHTLLTGVLYAFAGWYYGFGDVSRPIQSVFIAAPFSMSVLQYLAWSYLVKLMTSCLYTMLFLFICVWFKSPIGAYASVAIALGANAVFYYVIAPYSYFNFLKYINVYYFLQPSRLLTTYININIFSQPYSLLPIAIVFCAIAWVILFFVTVRSFSCHYENSRNSWSLTKRFPIKLPHVRTTHLFSAEGFRFLVAYRVILVVLIFIIFQFWKSDAFKMRVTPDEVNYRNVLETALQQPDPYDWAIKQKEHYDNHGARRMDIDAMNRLLERFSYLDEIEKESGKRGALVYDSGYDKLTNNPRNDVLNALIMVILLIVCISQLRERVLHNLFKTMPLGRGRQTRIKIIWLIITASVIFVLTYLPDLWQAKRVFGLPNLSAEAFSSPILHNVRCLSLAGYLFFLYLSRLFLSWNIAMIIYIISKKGITSSMMLPSAIFIVPLLLDFFSIKIVDYYPFNVLLNTNVLHKMGDFFSICLPLGLFIVCLIQILSILDFPLLKR